MEEPNFSTFTEQDFTSSCFSAFRGMKERGELVDCKIAVQNRCFSAHRLILAARIPLFQKLFANAYMGIIRVGEEVDPDILETVINFAYTGVITITPENVRPLLSVSICLEIPKVLEACTEFLKNRICLDNVWQFRTLAEDHDLSTLVKTCDSYIRANFETLSKSTVFLTFPFSYLDDVMSSGEAEISSEENMFEAVVKWTKFSPLERNDLFPQLLKSIRMTQLTPEYLVERVSAEELVQKSIACRDLVDKAKNYHLLQRKTSENLCSTQSHCESDPHWNSCFRIYAVSNSFVKSLDLENSKWITLSTRHISCIYHVVAVYGKIYVFSRRYTEILDLKTTEWRSVTAEHGSLHASGIIVHNKGIYCFGGKGDSAQKVRRFDVQKNKWDTCGEMRNCRMYSGLAPLKDLICLTGGTSHQNEVCNTVELYNTQTQRWTEVSPMLCGRYDHGCGSLKSKVYVCGGFNGRYLHTAEIYDRWTNQWNYISSAKTPKMQYSVVPHGGKLYALGRWSRNNRNEVDVDIYDPETDEWGSGLTVPQNDGDEVLVLTAIPA